MCRVAAFGHMYNEHRAVSIGGRKRNSRVCSLLNTDNATQHDCEVRTSAEVHNGRSLFCVDLPEQDDEYCRVQLNILGRWPKVYAATQAVKADTPSGVVLESLASLRNVSLSVGPTLDVLMACYLHCTATGWLANGLNCKELSTELIRQFSPRRSIIRS